jgi:hypothetical protein
MKNLQFFGLFFIFAVIVYGCNNTPKTQQAGNTPPQSTKQDTIKHGEYLVSIGGCHDCHSPKQPSGQSLELIQDRLLSGYPADRPVMKTDMRALKQGWVLINYDITQAAGPWGVSFSANLTSDQTGVGNWTEDQFLRALKQGWFKGLEGTRKLLPPMPWEMLANMKDEDAKAIFAFLQSTRPISNAVPAPIPPDQMAAMK